MELLERTRGVMVAAELDRRAGHDHLAWQTIDWLAAAAADAPVVYLYDGPLRCEALILTQGWDSADAGHVRVVQLSVSGSEVWDKADRLTALVRTEPADRAVEDEVLGILGWLRDRVTGPVLAAIGHDRLAASEPGRPRIWWCPVGIFSFLPLHATCLGEAVSSYAFTARSLRYARSQPLPSDRAASAPLVIAVPDAPGALPLPGADREADRIVGILPTAFRLERPTRKAVLAALPRYLVAHFACHGSVNSDDPGLSQLFLNDHVEDPLTVADIRSLRLTGGLAFLSACETAVTTVNLANEALHLTGAFQLAGYQHVVGTLWTVSDFASVALVRDFYTGLTAPGQKVIEVARAATALHDATRRLRDRFPNRPTLWAGHIHVGP